MVTGWHEFAALHSAVDVDTRMMLELPRFRSQSPECPFRFDIRLHWELCKSHVQSFCKSVKKCGRTYLNLHAVRKVALTPKEQKSDNSATLKTDRQHCYLPGSKQGFLSTFKGGEEWF